MLGPDGLVKMLERTQTGSVMGTLRYISPEQAGGEKLDPRSNVSRRIGDGEVVAAAIGYRLRRIRTYAMLRPQAAPAIR